MKVQIRVPIFNTQSVGIKTSLIKEDLEVEILYENLNGERTFPGIYKMSKGRALNYPSKKFGNTPKLTVIPISAFERVIK